MTDNPITISIDIQTSRTGEVLLIAAWLLKKVMPARIAAPFQCWVVRRFCTMKGSVSR